MSTRVFVSPGVYTSEKDLTFVTRQVGVTTLGLVGETTIGPAFQPIFVSNYGEFQSFFGGLNATKVKDTGAPLYELPYIAKSYLTNSNQLFVTRVLGLSGYDAGLAWGITLDGALDPSTTGTTGGSSFNPLITYSASTGGVISDLASQDPFVQLLIDNGSLTSSLAYLGSANTGSTANVGPVFIKNLNTFSGVSMNIYVNNKETIITPDFLNKVYVTGNTYPSAFNAILNYTAATGGVFGSAITAITSQDTFVQSLINDGKINTTISALTGVGTGTTFTSELIYTISGSVATIFNMSIKVVEHTFNGTEFIGVASGTTFIYTATTETIVTGSTTGVTTYITGTAYSDVENKLVALLRSRGTIDVQTQLPNFEVSGSTDVQIDPNYTGSTSNPLGLFALSGFSNKQGLFDYQVSLDRTQRNYLPKVLGRGAQDGNTALFVEELYDHMFKTYNAEGKIRGVKQELVEYGRSYSDYLNEYQPAVTPYVVSELRGNKVLRLFRFWTISDGNAANEQFKISIVNIKPDVKEFDVRIRAYYDTDAQPVILESFTRCTMDPTSANYIGRRIGTLDGVYVSKSSYVLVEIDDTSNTSEAFPAGFVGYPTRDYQTNSNTDVVTPNIMYKKEYATFENKRKFYLGLSQTVGIDSDFFDYKGVPTTTNPNMWTGLTKGFHMDVDATGVTIDNVYTVINASGGTYSPVFYFETGVAEFRTESGLLNGPYEKIYARKFTFVPYGGFDGWDIYNTRRTNTDKFLINGVYGQYGLNSGAFKNRTLSNGDLGINSDYYAYLEAIWTFKNPEAVNINVFATPGIDNFDNTNLIESTIEMIETDRADSLYIMTTPDYYDGSVLSVDDVADNLTDMYDSNYSCTYWPWVQINDAENNVLIFVPPTRDVVRNIALTDNIAFPWYAVAGIQRGDVDAIQARKKLTEAERDVLYENRINPITSFTSEGIKIWGNKTLQVKDTALNRINVRRLLLQARKLISAVSIRLLFEQNDSIVRNQFLSLVNPILDNIRTERGLTDFRVVLSNDPEDIDKNQLTGQIFLKPTRSLEFIQIEFVIMNTGASFDNV